MKLVRNILVASLIVFNLSVGAQTKAPVTSGVVTNQAPVSVPASTAPSVPAQPVVSTSNLNVAVVDVMLFQQQFMDEVNTKLEADFKDRQASIQKMVSQFRTDQEKLQKDADIMSAKKVEEAKNSLVKQQNDLQVEAKKYDDDLNKRRQQEFKVKLDNLMEVVNSVSSKNKYDMVLAKNATLYVDQKYDITDQVVKGYKDISTKTAANSKNQSKKKA